MTLSLAKETPQTEDSAFRVAIRKFDVQDWRFFLGSQVSKGLLDLDLTVKAREAGQRMDLDFKGHASDLAGLLKGKTVSASSLTGAGTIGYIRKGRAELKTHMYLTNLVVTGTNEKPVGPLTIRLNVDGGKDGQKLDFRELLLSLSPTARASNQIKMTGTLDLRTNRPGASQLVLTSDSLDVTPLYEPVSPAPKVVKGPKARSKRAKRSPEVPEPSEPEPVSLPIGELDLAIKIKQFFLRDLAINNLVVEADLKDNKLRVKPFSVMVNGAPVTGALNVNLGVPGYQYNVKLDGQKVPLEPLVNIFSPEDARSYKCNLDINTELRGKGITGKNLKKNLHGHFKAAFTNAEIKIVSPKIQDLLVPIASVLRIPELTETSIHWLTLNAGVDNGKINVTEFTVAADAFHAHSQGVVALAPVFCEIPAEFACELFHQTFSSAESQLAQFYSQRRTFC